MIGVAWSFVVDVIDGYPRKDRRRRRRPPLHRHRTRRRLPARRCSWPDRM